MKVVLHRKRALPTDPEPEAPSQFIPIGTHNLFRWESSEASIDTKMGILQGEKHTCLRDNIEWRLTETSQGVFDWSRTDRWMRQAALKGFTRVYVPITHVPAWASSGNSGGDQAAPLTSLTTFHARWNAFVTACVARYNSFNGSFWVSGGGVGMPRPQIYFELWNEPWGSWAWRNVDGSSRTPSGSEYANMCKSTVQYVRNAGHVSGGYKLLWHTNSIQSPGTNNYHEDMWTAVSDLGSYCDGWSVHPYPEYESSNPNADPDYYPVSGSTPTDHWNSTKYTFRRFRALHEFDLSHGSDLPLHITEIGWPTATNALAASQANRVVTEADQNQHYASVFNILRQDTDKLIYGLVLYENKDHYSYSDATVENGQPRNQNREFYFGARRSDNNAKPALTSINTGIVAGIESPSEGTPPTSTPDPITVADTGTLTVMVDTQGQMTLAKPAIWQDRVCLAFFLIGNSVGTVSPPDGTWDLLESQIGGGAARFELFGKKLTSGAPDPVFTIGGIGKHIGGIISFDNVDDLGIISASNSGAFNNLQIFTAAALSNPDDINPYELAIFGFDQGDLNGGGSFTTPSGMSELVDYSTGTTSGDRSIGIFGTPTTLVVDQTAPARISNDDTGFATPDNGFWVHILLAPTYSTPSGLGPVGMLMTNPR
jgi:hypothetical protein